MYKPYTPEWHRFRNLKESLDAYLEQQIEPKDIIADITSILDQKASAARKSYEQVILLQTYLTDQ